MIYEKFGPSKKMNPDEYGSNRQLQMISAIQCKDGKMDLDMHSCMNEGENLKDMSLLDECG